MGNDPMSLVDPNHASINMRRVATVGAQSTTGAFRSRQASTMVGSLGSLDLRGTNVTPSGLVACLWGLTHHPKHHSEEASDQNTWCKVWFEALHLGSTTPASGTNDGWTSEDLARLETVLAMDEMRRKILSKDCESGGRAILYVASRVRP
jgi:hypothetical protein